MSMFPAYSCDAQNSDQDGSVQSSQQSSKWLENTSFWLPEHQFREVQSSRISSITVGFKCSESSDNEESFVSDEEKDSKTIEKCYQKEKSEKVLKVKHLEFQGDEGFYVDKQPSKHYETIQELHKPACPRYRKSFIRALGGNSLVRKKLILKRYYRLKIESVDSVTVTEMTENEFTEEVRRLNRQTMESPKDLQAWLELIDLQSRNPYKLSKLMLAERKIDIIHKALNCNPKNDELYHRYIDIINSTYPSFEVNKLLDRLLNKDPYSYVLWTAQILATQCSMARCIVPDVLKIYERCMQKMYYAVEYGKCGGGGDDVMLKLFNNCALFLRQAGLYEQFFALIKLALELNISTDKIEELRILDSDQATLVEYEELILQSGLPMNEIWLRIEKLRQAFNFLPISLNVQCSDPQRIVFNEDVCHYIYPLKSRENSFYMILLVLRLLKFPFIQSDRLAEKFYARVEGISDSDAIEDALTTCLSFSFPMGVEQETFFTSLYDLAKEMAVSPTFLSSNIGHEIYIRCIVQILLNCANAYSGIDERKRIALLLLWCRFERLLLMLQKCAKKLTVDYIRAGRSRFKALLKQESNNTVTNLYTEFAFYEYEAMEVENPPGNMQTVCNIFGNITPTIHSNNDSVSSDICFACVTYAQMLLSKGRREDALWILYSYIMKVDIKQKPGQVISNPKKLIALQAISKKLDDVIAIERNVDTMVLEQYLSPDSIVSLLKVRVLLQYLMGQKLNALSYLNGLLNIFKNTSERSSFLREQIYELYIAFARQKSEDCSISNAVICAKMLEALNEFPRNLYFMQNCGTFSWLPWYKVRAGLLGANISAMSLIFLIATARYRFMDRLAKESAANVPVQISGSDIRHNESIVRNRLLNIFGYLTVSDNDILLYNKCIALRRNSLFWRLYLRCLSDESITFETSKKCLLQALDECPWSKALYMDGAKYVPQELSHLQDLLIEKQMRICALPDELEILREK